MANTKYDWEQISSEYIQGYWVTDPENGYRKHVYPSLEDLQNKYGCSAVTIRLRCANDKWVLKRNVFKAKIRDHVNERKISTFLSESAKYDALTLHKVGLMHKLIDHYLDQYSDILDTESDLKPMALDDIKINVKDLESMVRMVKEMHTLVRNVVGEPVQSDGFVAELNNLTNNSGKYADATARKNHINKLQKRLKEKAARKEQLEKELATMTNESNTN